MYSDLQIDVDQLKQTTSFEQKLSDVLGASIGFENVDTISLKDSHEFRRMKSVDLTASLEAGADKKNDVIDQETVVEKIYNFGTNVKYAFRGLGQKDLQENPLYMLGKQYKKIEDFRKDFQSVIWCTYRRNFPRILSKVKGLNEIYTNDTGWGCMIRATQMMFAEVLTRKVGPQTEDVESLQEEIISWMLDGEDVCELAPYSIHSICECLFENMNVKPGQWFKASQILLSLEAMHKKYKPKAAEDLEIAVFLEGTIYLDQILDKVCPEPKKEFEMVEDSPNDIKNLQEEIKLDKQIKAPSQSEADNQTEANNSPKNSKEDSPEKQYEDKGDLEDISDVSSGNSADATEEAKAKLAAQMKSKWSRSIFFIVLAKVGLDGINSEYIPCIQELLSYPESVGMIGGRPGNAYYFLGYQDDDLIYLDPHLVQDACLTKLDFKEQKSTYFCEKPRTISFSKIDTSIALGFYIKNEDGFLDFKKRLQKTAKKSSSFFGFEKYTPVIEDFDDDVSFEDDDPRTQDGEYTML